MQRPKRQLSLTSASYQPRQPRGRAVNKRQLARNLLAAQDELRLLSVHPQSMDINKTAYKLRSPINRRRTVNVGTGTNKQTANAATSTNNNNRRRLPPPPPPPPPPPAGKSKLIAAPKNANRKKQNVAPRPLDAMLHELMKRQASMKIQYQPVIETAAPPVVVNKRRNMIADVVKVGNQLRVVRSANGRWLQDPNKNPLVWVSGLRALRARNDEPSMRVSQFVHLIPSDLWNSNAWNSTFPPAANVRAKYVAAGLLQPRN